jgi:glutamine amidotransferase
MSAGTIAIVDYGAGNLRSIHKALEHVIAGADRPLTVQITADPMVIAGADAVVLPGVGAARATMDRLHATGLVGPLRAAATDGRPFLGICLGLQLLFEQHEEGGVAGLGVLPGAARRFPGGLKVPHMGWNVVQAATAHPFLAGIDPDPYFYFVHSYYVAPTDPALVIGTTDYGPRFCSVLARGTLWATQFHPEKSGPAGLRLLDNFVTSIRPVPMTTHTASTTTH